MTEKDRYEYWKESDTAYDTKRRYGQYFHIIDKKECVDLLNQKEEEITFLKSENMEMEDYIGRLEKQVISIIDQFNYIQNSIVDKIKNQKTKIGEKALREVLEDYDEWMLGHKGV